MLSNNMGNSDWFKGFEKGIAKLTAEQREQFFSECGKNCVNGGTLSVYRQLYEDAKGDLDVFFQMAKDLSSYFLSVYLRFVQERLYHYTFTL